MRSVCGLKEGKAPSLRVFRGAVYMFPDEECVWFERRESSIVASVQRSCVPACSLMRSVCGLKEGKAPSLQAFRGAVYRPVP